MARFGFLVRRGQDRLMPEPDRQVIARAGDGFLGGKRKEEQPGKWIAM
jgi:hypothetical protein